MWRIRDERREGVIYLFSEKYRFKTNTHDNTNFTVRLNLWCFEPSDKIRGGEE